MPRKKAQRWNEYIEAFPIGNLIPYENNPRLNSEAVHPVANSIRDFGFNTPITVDEDYVIVTGHTRRLAAIELGLEVVPVVILHGITPEKARAYRLADNKTNELSGWDFDALDLEFDALGDAFVMEDYGFLDQKYEQFDEEDGFTEEVVETVPTEHQDGPYLVVAEFESEKGQKDFYERLINEGYIVRLG